MKKHKRTQRFLIAAIVAIFFAASHIAAQNVSEAELQFREALHKQQVEGDLAGAIRLYQNIASSKNGDRAVKARALLQLAGCFEALGRQSANVYQQIVRDFADQPAAAQAKTKLAALRPPAPPSTMTMRKIEFGDGVQNVVATDGQRAVYWDAKQTTLYFGDVKGKDKRIIFQPKESVRDISVSRDLTMVFLYLEASRGQGVVGRYVIVKTDGTGYRDLTLIENGNKVQATAIRCLSWSWDNRYLAMCKRRPGGTQLVKISVADGEMLGMLGERTPGVSAAQFSPDGRFIAYSEMGSGLTGWNGPVRVIPVQGGEPQLIAEGAMMVGDWTRDGRYLMIGELQDRFAANPADKIFAVPFQNGKAIGERVSINASNIGLPQTYLNGTMIITARQFQPVHFSLGVLNSEGHLGPWKTLELNESGQATDWSPDGRQIVYTAGLNSNAVRVRNFTTGEDREVYRSSGYIRCLWARQQPKLFCAQISSPPLRTDILSIALDSGRAEKTGSLAGFRWLWSVSSDDRMLVMNKHLATAVGFDTLQWEIGTDPASEKPAPARQSGDGRWVWSSSYPDGRRGIMIRPTSGDNDDVKLLVQTRMLRSDVIFLAPIRFTSDSKWIVYHDKDADGKDGLYRVSVSGGPPERLGDYPSSEPNSYLYISPDGRQFLAGDLTPPKPPAFWVLENVIPAAAASAKPAAKAPAK